MLVKLFPEHEFPEKATSVRCIRCGKEYDPIENHEKACILEHNWEDKGSARAGYDNIIMKCSKCKRRVEVVFEREPSEGPCGKYSHTTNVDDLSSIDDSEDVTSSSE